MPPRTGPNHVRRRHLLAAVAAVALVAGGCGEAASTSSDGKTAVTVGVIPIVDVAPLYLGVEKGFFAEENLEVKLETAQGGVAIVPAVISDQFQFGFSNTTSLLLAQSQGLAVRVVSSGVASTGAEGEDFGAVIAKADGPIRTAKDLAGKRVAVNTLKNINTTTVNHVVREAGGDPSTISYVELPFPEIAAAVANGEVDAGQVVEPFLTLATGDGHRQVVSNYAGTSPNMTVGMYFTSDRYAEENPRAVTAFEKAMKKSLDYAQQHPDEARGVLESYTQIDSTVRDDLVLPTWPSEIDQESVRLLAELAKDDGLITKPLDVDALLP
ncbi:ABC transporter substrate-binding protein [Actinophytocola xanthii]|uniref:Nitrate ABC transporter substrate-binding protein n=1 Tax=Actinophytocola xanthii TaxID=1912961 RepID=A0A1Q8CXQ9_9PSEU|nr:ABC transporter substrate-binding protein [Actinophytocola xanthii]OLF19148.1 nitrate ABC transporter substrate-binding protein [Actinophytocola xanthii]